MNTVLIACLAVFISSINLRATDTKESKILEVISSTMHDINSDGSPESIQIVLTKGGYQHKIEDGLNEEGFVGEYNLRVLSNGNVLCETSLNNLFYPYDKDNSQLLFPPQFKLVFDDYNDDGLIDFNIGQYGASQLNVFKLFTIDNSGKVSRLAILGMNGEFSCSTHEYSTGAIEKYKGLLTFVWRAAGDSKREFWRWNGKGFEFITYGPTWSGGEETHPLTKEESYAVAFKEKRGQ